MALIPAMLPPPAPISIMLTAGTATGKPLERVNRRERATSSSSVIGIAPSRMRHAFAVVSPMSNDRTSGSASACAIWRPTMAPATGPDSMSRSGKSAAVSVEPRPPLDSITRSSAAYPVRAASPASRLPR